jgi:integrase
MLNDLQVRRAKPKAKDFKLSDSKGLFLLVRPSGSKVWRYRWRRDGKERQVELGSYPLVSLKEARELHFEAQKAVKDGRDPAAEKRTLKAARKASFAVTFDGVASEYVERIRRDGKSDATVLKLEWMRKHWLKSIGQRPIAEIKPPELLPTLQELETKGNLETARRVRAFASRVFRFAAATARCENDPAAILRGATSPPRSKPMAAILEPKRVGELLRQIDAYSGTAVVRLAMQLLPNVMSRPGELRNAEWTEFNLNEAIWTIPAARMKQRKTHRVPLSLQAIAILHDIKGLTGGGKYLLPAQWKGGRRPMSENTINAAFRRMGFSGSEMVSHGWRSIASTFLNESGKWRPDVVERALAHADNNAVRGIYNRGEYWGERVELAQWWSDYLDKLRQGEEVVFLAKRNMN